MIEAATSYKNAVVIGGGLLGLEAANGLMKRGMNVTVVHLLDTLMERQLDQVAGGICCASRSKSAAWCSRCRRRREAILGEDRVTGVRFADGEEIAADLVVMAVGIRPNVELARKAGPPLRARHRRVRHHADLRRAHLRGRRMRAASRVRPTASWRRCSSRPRFAPTTSP